ncbi:MAG: sialate O-acetylesterase [Clostridia bacterium]
MSTNVTNLKGVSNFQIIQQKNGKADITIKGSYIIDDDHKYVWLKIVSEDYNLSVVDWKMADFIDDSHFTITFKDVPAGGLYRIESGIMTNINGCTWALRGDSIFHFGIGDLFIIAGQSNSAGYSRTPIEDTMELGVHLYRNSQNWDIASHPMNDSTNSVHEVNSEGANPGHCPYLAFGKKMKRFLGYPIGLIQTSRGGSALSSWNTNEEGELYANMINVVSDCTDNDMHVAGILWYQGCTDADLHLTDTYFDRFKLFTENVRRDFKDKALPIYTVQLNKILDIGNTPRDLSWGAIREIQRQIAIKIPNVFIVPTIDLGLSDAIHNNSLANISIGERLANVALSETYKKLPSAKAPNLTKATKTSDNEITFSFENVVGFITTIEAPYVLAQFDISINGAKANVQSYSSHDNKIIISLDTNVIGKTEISYCNNAFVHQIVPYDVGTGMPVLAFSITELF